MMNFSGFSQTSEPGHLRLTPIVQQLQNDTVFCFKIGQARALAKLIVKGQFQDSIASELEVENTRLFQVLGTKDSTISKLEMTVMNFEQIGQNQQQSMVLLEGTIQAQRKQIKRTRFHRTLLAIGLGVITVVAIAN